MTDTEQDFLEVDAQIRGQDYCCISFVSPEEVLNNKDIFYFQKYLKNISTRYSKVEEALNKYVPKDELGPLKIEEFSMDGVKLQQRYKDFLYVNSDKLESEFYEQNEFKTSVRGVKVRGSYDTLAEAQSKAKKLQQVDKNFNVYIGQVGYWLPWDPNPHKIDNQEYGEQELNTLVKKYRENQDKKDEHFRENIDYAREQADKQKAEKEEAEKARSDKHTLVGDGDGEGDGEGEGGGEGEGDTVVNTETSTDAVDAGDKEATGDKEAAGDKEATGDNIFAGDSSRLESSLEGSDPWLDRKS